jgi:hypothetical protein
VQPRPEVDEHIATEDGVHLADGVVGDEVVLEEDHVLAQRLGQGEPSVGTDVVVLEGSSASGLLVVLLEDLEAAHRIDGLARVV